MFLYGRWRGTKEEFKSYSEDYDIDCLILQSKEKTYVDIEYARKPLDFNLLRISSEVLIKQTIYLPFLITILYKLVSNRSNKRDSSVVGHGLELIIKYY